MRASINILYFFALVTGITALPTTLDVVGYWGVHGGNVGEKNLGYYCGTGAYTIINLSFIDALSNPHNLTADIPAAASSNGNIVSDIQACQASGVRIFISIGGYIANVPISDSATGEAYADGLWNSYFGGNDPSYYRPFGHKVVLDGLDLDLEQSSTSGYGALVKKLKSYFDNSGRKYWISAAPQCGIPDPNMDSLLKSVWFDYVNPQFYNNWCYFSGPNMNYENVSAQYGQSWVQYSSNFVNPNTKVLLGVPAPGGGNGGANDVLPYVQTVVPDLARNHPNLFGGVMFWDCFWAGPTWAKSIRAVVDQACGGKCKTGGPSGTPVVTSTPIKSTTTSAFSTKTTATTPSTTPSKSSSTKTTKTRSTTPTATSATKPSITSSASTSSAGSIPTSGPCSSSGQMVCLSSDNSPSYVECVGGKWTVFSCASGTVCLGNGSSIYCSYKQRRVRRRAALH